MDTSSPLLGSIEPPPSISSRKLRPEDLFGKECSIHDKQTPHSINIAKNQEQFGNRKRIKP